LQLNKEQLVLMQKSMGQYSRDLELKKEELDWLEKSFEECCDKLGSKEKQLETVKDSLDKYSDEVKMKGKEVELGKKRLKDCAEKFVLKERELCRVPKLIEEKAMELKSKEKHLESIKILIKENSEELEAKEKQFDQIGRLIKERTMELKVKENEFESIDEVQSKEKQLDSVEELYRKFCEDFELKQREYNAIRRSIEELNEELEFKGNQLNSRQNLSKECDKELKSKQEELRSIQKAIVECLKEQKSKEKELYLVEKSVKECADSLESKEKQLKFVQETVNEGLKKLELKEKHLASLKKSMDELSHNLEMRERQVKERVKELDLKEKQFDSIKNNLEMRERKVKERVKELELREKKFDSKQISLKETIKEKELKGSTNDLPIQVKTEQHEHTPANNAIMVHGEVSTILQTASDPSKLVLDAMHGFYPPHSREGDMVFDVNIIRRSCILLLQQLMKTSKVVKPQVREAAMKLAVEWKAKMKVDNDNGLEVLGFLQLLATYGLGSGFNEDELQRLFLTIDQHRLAPELCRTLGIIYKAPVASALHSQWKTKFTASAINSLEVLAFLLLLATYELTSSFNRGEILKLFEAVAEYKQALEVCQNLGFTDQIPDFIKNLIERKIYIKAVRFICAFKLVDKFPPVPLLKKYLENSRSSTKNSCKRMKSLEEMDKAANREIAALRDVLGCITDYNLESQFPPKDIERRVLELEKLKAERRNAASTSAVEFGPKQPDVKKCDNSGSACKQQAQPQNRNKRARTAVSTKISETWSRVRNCY
ncbi:hypothetical protein ACB092_04G168300, partial [Castanea dentata]